MSRRLHWIAIAIGLALLGNSSLESQVRETYANYSTPIPAGGTPEEIQRARMLRALRSKWRVDAQISERIVDSALRCETVHHVRGGLVLAVLIKESSVRPWARSPKGAIGLMQVMPHMYAELDLPGGVGHIESNIEAGCLILADNIRRLGEDDGISAYFWGSEIKDDRYLRGVREIERQIEMLIASAAPARG